MSSPPRVLEEAPPDSASSLPELQPLELPIYSNAHSANEPENILRSLEKIPEKSFSLDDTCGVDDAYQHVDSDKKQTVKQVKRPVSYPCGPEYSTEVLQFNNNKKRYSDPLKPLSVGNSLRGKAQVKPFTKESLERLEKKTVQLVREYGFQPKRKLSVEDGSRLPVKYEPFPSALYGRPLEEIDNFIYDEVSVVLLYFFYWYSA